MVTAHDKRLEAVQNMIAKAKKAAKVRLVAQGAVMRLEEEEERK